MKGYKGFNKDWSCRDTTYKIGETVEIDHAPKACERGFHFCENPLDLFSYYSPGESVYAEVEALGEVDARNEDSKISTNKLKVCCEISLKTIVEFGIKFIFEKVKWNKGNSSTGDRSGAQATGFSSGAQATGNSSGAQATGNRSGAQATGNSSGAQATGNSSGAQATGDRSGAQATGDRSIASTNGNYSKSEILNTTKIKSKNAVAICTGAESTARAPIGCWMVVAEWDEYNNKIIDLKSVRVDGEVIKENTFYKVKNGKFVEVEK